jgi:hypothetical protein
MFGFSSCETESIGPRKIHHHDDAKARWLCLSTLDLSQINNTEQFITLVKIRYGLPEAQAKEQVESWMAAREP